MYKEDKLYYCVAYSVEDIKNLLINYRKEVECNKQILKKLVVANKLRFTRYFDFFDWYFKNRITFENVQGDKSFYGKFNLTHDFIIAGILCSIIETYYQFLLGINETPKPHVQAYKYVFSLLENSSNCYSNDNAKQFYEKIRNGLIHQTNTNIKAALSEALSEPIQYQQDIFLVDIEKVYQDIRDSIYSYFTKITDVADLALVDKFIKKTEYIVNY